MFNSIREHFLERRRLNQLSRYLRARVSEDGNRNSIALKSIDVVIHYHACRWVLYRHSNSARILTYDWILRQNEWHKPIATDKKGRRRFLAAVYNELFQKPISETQPHLMIEWARQLGETEKVTEPKLTVEQLKSRYRDVAV